MTTITLTELLSLLACTRGARFATITAVTDARLLKTGNPFGQVNKRSRFNAVINHRYENSVNNQRAREGNEAEFTAKPRKWGTRFPGTPFVTHKGRAYLDCGIQRSLSCEYITDKGRTLTPDDVKPFQSDKGSNAEHQGVEKEIILRDYGVDTIESIAIDGEVYRVDPASIDAALALVANVVPN